MKYKVDDKVRYDGGDWWFYGTVSAVFEHSISPCYRLNVERMEKKSCRFSITQFEFELEPWGNAVASGKDERKREKVVESTPPQKERVIRKRKTTDAKNIESAPPQKEGVIRKRKTTDAWDKNLESYRKEEKSNVLRAWVAKNRKDYKTGILSAEKFEKLKEINFPFEIDKQTSDLPKKEVKRQRRKKQQNEPSKQSISGAWEKNLESYRKGERSVAVFNWISLNRKLHETGTLSKEKFEKLQEINFDFGRKRRPK